MSSFKFIALDKLLPPVFDPRLTINESDDIELAESIRAIGILEPLLVRKVNTNFEIIAGHRRFIAAGKVGLASAPCIIKTSSESEIEIIKLHENMKRLPLSHIDQAVTFLHLMEKFDMTEGQVSTLVGKSVAYVSQHLCLLQSDPILVESVRDGKINFTVARELMQTKNPDELQRFIKYAKDDGVTAQVAKHWVEDSNRETIIVDNSNDDQEPQLPPRPSNEPGFKCPACDEWHEVTKLTVVRLCMACNYEIFKAIKEEKKKISVSTGD